MWKYKKISKIAYFYWGGQPFSFLRYISILSFHKYNPDWQIIVYRPKIPSKQLTWKSSEQKIGYTGKDYFDKLFKIKNILIKDITFSDFGFNDNISEVHKSDILRWFLLGDAGGAWIDCDIIFVKPIECMDYFHPLTDTIISIMSCNRYKKYPLLQMFVPERIKTWNYHSIGYLLSKPDNAYFKSIFAQCQKNYDPSQYQSVGSKQLNDKFKNLGMINDKFPELHIGNLKKETVYSIDSYNIPLFFNDRFTIEDDHIGFHWFGGSKISGTWENILTETNYSAHKNFICHLIGNTLTN